VCTSELGPPELRFDSVEVYLRCRTHEFKLQEIRHFKIFDCGGAVKGIRCYYNVWYS
jgi:hypothetical protein